MAKSPSVASSEKSESSVVSVSTDQVSVSVTQQPEKEQSQDKPPRNQKSQNQDKESQNSQQPEPESSNQQSLSRDKDSRKRSQPSSTSQQSQNESGSENQSQSGACLPEFMQPRRQSSLSPAVKKASAILIDILFSVLVIYMVFLYLGFRSEKLRVHQWFGIGEGSSAGHTINTIFAMLMAAIAREVSQPVAHFARRVFETITHRVEWDKN